MEPTRGFAAVVLATIGAAAIVVFGWSVITKGRVPLLRGRELVGWRAVCIGLLIFLLGPSFFFAAILWCFQLLHPVQIR